VKAGPLAHRPRRNLAERLTWRWNAAGRGVPQQPHRVGGRVVASQDAAAQAVRAVDNVEAVLRAAGAALSDVVAWTVLVAADADVAAAYGAIAPRLARGGAPPLVTAARVAGLAVPGALLEISAIAALTAD
jgi:enamine deaminase RidA (YjgF/YER057c/UK114 family)